MLRQVLICVLFVIAYSQCLAQNGWTKAKKSFYAQTAISSFSSKNFYSTNGTLFNGGSTYNSHALMLYGEYGITDQFNVVLDFPLLMLNHYSTTNVVGGVGNIKVGAKYRIFKKFPLALQADIEIPTDDGLNFATSKTLNVFGGYDQINLPTSDGEVNFWTTLAASHSLKKGTFGSIYAAANFRTKGFSHQYQFGFEIGQLLFSKLYLIAKFKIQGAMSAPNPFASFIYGEGTTFTQYNVTALYKLNDHWKIVGGASDMLGFPMAKRNLYDGFNYFLGISVEY